MQKHATYSIHQQYELPLDPQPDVIINASVFEDYESKCQEKLIYEMITDLYEKLDDVKRRSSNERFHKTV
jgi:hypothetical protein